MTNNPPKSVQRLNQINTPSTTDPPHSIGKENQKNIGTGTVNYWLWTMDQELRTAFGE